MKKMIKIQKAMTYPKAADMMQLLDANTEEYLPLKGFKGVFFLN